MSIVHEHRCDTCGALDGTHPDDGPASGWYLVGHIDQPGVWHEQYDFCSAACLNEFTWGDE